MKAEADLVDHIEAICLEFPRYGYRRVTRQLKREGWAVNHKRVLRLMRESDLLCRVKQRRVKTTDSKHHFPRYPNLLKGMVVSRINQVWLAGITYIRIRSGFVYLAAILDAHSRRVIGYAISTGLETSLTLKALRMAIAGRKPGPGVICYSHHVLGVRLKEGVLVGGADVFDGSSPSWINHGRTIGALTRQIGADVLSAAERSQEAAPGRSQGFNHCSFPYRSTAFGTTL